MPRKSRAITKETYRILVVDDQADVIETIVPILQREGYIAVGAKNGIEALEIVKNGGIDLVLLDYFMPGLTGEDIVREIRKFNREIFILLQTGYAGEKPPLEMLRVLNIQGYHDKTEGPDKLMLWISAGIRSCAQMRINRDIRDSLSKILNSVPNIFKMQTLEELLVNIVENLREIMDFRDAFCVIEDLMGKKGQFLGMGRFAEVTTENYGLIGNVRDDLIKKAKTTKEMVREMSTLVMPIMHDKKCLGTIYIENCILEREEFIDMIKIYLHQAAEAIINLHLHRQVIASNQKLKNSYLKLRRANYGLIEAFTKAVDAKDTYTAGHSTRVSLYARVIGKLIDLPKDEFEKLKLAALFHDIGKIGIPDNVLLKEGKLTEEEFNIIKSHPETGNNILISVSMLSEILPAVRHHHEKYDGRGYPDGLKGEEIPLHARILAIADAFDAMTSDRSYQKKRTYEEALKELERCAGTQFDPVMTKAFVEFFRGHVKFFNRLVAFWDHAHSAESYRKNLANLDMIESDN